MIVHSALKFPILFKVPMSRLTGAIQTRLPHHLRQLLSHPTIATAMLEAFSQSSRLAAHDAHWPEHCLFGGHSTDPLCRAVHFGEGTKEHPFPCRLRTDKSSRF